MFVVSNSISQQKNVSIGTKRIFTLTTLTIEGCIHTQDFVKIHICANILQPLLLLLLLVSSSIYLSCDPPYYQVYFQELIQTKLWDHLLSQQMKTSRRRRDIWIPISIYENILPVINIRIPLTYGFNSAFAMWFKHNSQSIYVPVKHISLHIKSSKKGYHSSFCETSSCLVTCCS